MNDHPPSRIETAQIVTIAAAVLVTGAGLMMTIATPLHDIGSALIIVGTVLGCAVACERAHNRQREQVTDRADAVEARQEKMQAAIQHVIAELADVKADIGGLNNSNGAMGEDMAKLAEAVERLTRATLDNASFTHHYKN